jgi:hypothetical protein
MIRTIVGNVDLIFLAFPLEHPIDAIKTQWQARPHVKNELAVIFLEFADQPPHLSRERRFPWILLRSYAQLHALHH